MQNQLDRFFIDLVLEEEQQVDVRLRMNGLAAITPHGKQCKSWTWPCGRFPELTNDGVHLVADHAFDRKHTGSFKEPDLQIVEKCPNIGPRGRHSAHVIMREPM